MTIRKKNKFVALLLALLLVVGMLPVSVMAAGSFTLEVGNVTAELKAGETVEVPITATANSGYVAGVLDVSWDKTALELTDVKYSQTLAPKGNSAPIPTNNPGKYTIDFGNNIATENYTGTGEFFKLVFKITDTAAAGDHAISLSGFQIYDFDINELPVTSNPGKVTLTGGSGGAKAMTLEVGNVTAELKAGETVEVPITATANSGYVAGVLDVSWDKTALELTDVKYSQTLAPKGNSAPIPTNNPGKYTIDFGNNVATENYTGTGEFFKLVFKITDTAAAGDHAISLSGFQIYDFDINELTVTSNPGKVTLTGGSGGAKAMTLDVGSVTAELKAGETVEVPITATANSGYVAGVLDVSWDKTALELTDVTYSPTLAPKGNSAPIPTNNPGKYTIDFGNNVATENYTGTGEFFKLVFKITDTAAAGDHAISLSGFQIYDFDINELPVTSNPGKVTLTGASVKPTITTTSLPEGTVGASYSATLNATGTTPITWSVSSGTLPAGLSLSGNTISGTPTTAGTANITVKAVNVAGEATKNLSIKINAAPVKPTITTTSLAEGTVGTAYSATLEATGTTPITWSVSSGTLPAGLSLSGNTISGTPTTAGTANITVKAANVAGEATKNLSIKINAASVKPAITTTTLPEGTVGTAYSATLEATGTTPITWSVSSGTLPAGLSLAADGKISGTPTTAGDYTFTVKATNGAGSDTKSYTVTIAPADATTYTVTFKDGENVISTATVNSGEKVAKPVDPSKSGYSFDGWYEDPTFNIVFDFDQPITANASVYAKFTPITYTVTVNSGTADKATAAAGETVTLTADAAPSGKTFDKWVVNAGGVSLADENASNTTFTMPAAGVEVTATYKDLPPVTYTVTVNSGTADKVAAAAGETVTLTADTAPTGKAFDKWVVNAGGVSLTDENASSTTFTMPAAAVEVTATYKDIPPVTYTVTFKDGENVISTATVNSGEKVAKPTDPSKSGYSFDGWYEDPTFNIVFDFDQPITANASVYAKFSPITVTGISIATPGKTAYTVGDALDVSGMEIKVDYSDGTSTTIPVTAAMVSGFDSSAPAASQTLTITYEGKTTTYDVSISTAAPVTYDITVNVGAHGTALASAASAAAGTTITVTATPDSGYEIDKITWTPEGGTATDITSTKSFTMPAAKVTVNVSFKASSVTPPGPITVTGISIATPGKTAYTVGDALDVSGMEIKVDYSDGTSATIPVAAAMVSGFDSSAPATSQTLTITYEGETTTYDVSISATAPATYDIAVNVGANGTASASAASAAAGTTITITATPNSGYEIDKITWTPDGGSATDITSSKSFTMPAAKVTVDVSFKASSVTPPGPTTYTVTFKDGENTLSTATVNSGEKVAKPADPTKTGYTFNGWYADATFAVAFDFDQAITANTTVYAKFTDNSVTPPATITYTVTGGADSTWTKGSNATVTITVKRSEDDANCFTTYFDHVVEIDGTALAASDYEAKSGSTVITIKAAALQKLSTGNHTVTVKFKDGEASTGLTVKAASGSTDNTSPKTGDESNLRLWVLLMLMSILGFITTVAVGLKKRQHSR